MVTSATVESIFMRSLRKEKTNRTPVWLMRQAGRYMKEYRAIRERMSFLELCKDSDLASEITVFAVEELGVDAGIIFADILLPLEPMGLGLRFVKGDGPVIDNPIGEVSDIERLPSFSPSEDLAFVLKAIAKTTASLRSTPLLGFAGAPFTLASYAIEGGSSRNYERTKKLMYCEPDAWERLMVYLRDMTATYLEAQIDAGASAVQVFDSWVGCLSPFDYQRFVLPHMQALIERVKRKAPVIYFGTSTSGLLELFAKTGADCLGVDWRIELGDALRLIGEGTAVQGNLDPLVLFATESEIERQAKHILDQAAGRNGHIFNLGHGVLPGTPVDHVKHLVEYVHGYEPEHKQDCERDSAS